MKQSVKNLLPLPATDFQLLLLLCKEPMHAYGIAGAAGSDGGARLEIGSLYRVLARMLKSGLIEEIPPKTAVSGNEAKRKYFRITPLGRKVASAEARRLKSALETAVDRKLIEIPWRTS